MTTPHDPANGPDAVQAQIREIMGNHLDIEYTNAPGIPEDQRWAITGEQEAAAAIAQKMPRWAMGTDAPFYTKMVAVIAHPPVPAVRDEWAYSEFLCTINDEGDLCDLEGDYLGYSKEDMHCFYILPQTSTANG